MLAHTENKLTGVGTEELGYSAAPVVVVEDENHWSGFQPQKIDAVAAALGRTA